MPKPTVEVLETELVLLPIWSRLLAPAIWLSLLADLIDFCPAVVWLLLVWIGFAMLDTGTARCVFFFLASPFTYQFYLAQLEAGFELAVTHLHSGASDEPLSHFFVPFIAAPLSVQRRPFGSGGMHLWMSLPSLVAPCVRTKACGGNSFWRRTIPRYRR